MSTQRKPKISFSRLTEQVVREAAEPIPFDEIVRRVNALQRIDTRSPSNTIRTAIANCRLIAATGDGRYGWYPRLITGSSMRVILDGAELGHKPPRVMLDDDARELLWPSFFNFARRYDDRNPVDVRLPDGAHVEWPLEHFKQSDWGTTGSPAFWKWLSPLKPAGGDALIVEAVDAEARRYAVRFERAGERDPAAYDERNAAVYAAALKYMVNRRAWGTAVWDLARHLLATGAYKHPVPPQPITPIYHAAGEEVAQRALAEAGIYQLRITLQESEPPIWRRVLVPGDWSLGALHYVIQVAMGWTNSHMHMFRVGRRHISLYDLEFAKTTFSGDVKIGDVFTRPGKGITYEYDFGDSWMHEIELEAVVPPERGRAYPHCAGGERACPPEDCGGWPGYEDLLEAIRDPRHSEHESMMEWLSGMRGDDFDPDAFDPRQANERLARIRPWLLDDGRNARLFA